MAAATWSDPERGVVWKAEETSLTPGGAVSISADLVEDPRLPETWWVALRNGLNALAAHTTDRVALDQDHLTGRVHEVYGSGVDTRVLDHAWACAHGDLGYANLTGPDLMFLDWESWGIAPIGWDVSLSVVGFVRCSRGRGKGGRGGRETAGHQEWNLVPVTSVRQRRASHHSREEGAPAQRVHGENR